jgi:hypothetical protein
MKDQELIDIGQILIDEAYRVSNGANVHSLSNKINSVSGWSELITMHEDRNYREKLLAAINDLRQDLLLTSRNRR